MKSSTIMKVLSKEKLKGFEKVMWDIYSWKEVKKLELSCFLWKLRGLKSCKNHGFYAQSWINGRCKTCDYENLVWGLAEWMHDTYEEIAKRKGWDTQKSTKVPFVRLPIKNRETMLEISEGIIKLFK